MNEQIKKKNEQNCERIQTKLPNKRNSRKQKKKDSQADKQKQGIKSTCESSTGEKINCVHKIFNTPRGTRKRL